MHEGTHTANLLVRAELSELSNAKLWVRERKFGLDEALMAKSKNAQQARWQEAVRWLEQVVNPQEMYEKWYYSGLGTSTLSSTGEEKVGKP